MDTLNTFTAIDFETAQGKRNSICQIGLVRVEQGLITKTMVQLVKPPDNSYSFYNMQVHGITPAMTRNSPTFIVVWPYIDPFICNQNLVAHISCCDVSCVKQTLCSTYGIQLQHHDALSDAMACAKLFMRYNQQ